MFIKSRLIAVLSVLFCALATSWASPIEGIVKDAQGKPLAGAEIQVQKDGKLITRLNTDAHGHYVSGNLPAGVYKVDVLVGGVVKASIKNATLTGPKPVQYNFAMTGKTMTKGAKHFVWVPARTGSNLGGGWVEVNEDGTTGPSTERAQQLSRMSLEHASGTAGGTGSMPNSGGGGTP
ncbi:MAG: Carboxypeptidase regulatory-like domain [Verrucomicrobiota bacterium]|jgi:hypothetical protein